MAGAMSKFAERGGAGLGLARAAYVGAVLAYVGGVAVPRWLNYQQAERQKRRLAAGRGEGEGGSPSGSPEKKSTAGKRSGPAVNKEFFAQLSKLLKVQYSTVHI
jgi:hypothetical protein